jgi:hypothetical protein
MNRKLSFRFFVVSLAIALILSSSTIGNNDSLAKKYSKNQATTQASSCGNSPGADQLAAGISCQNINSHIQGDDNSVALAGVHPGAR